MVGGGLDACGLLGGVVVAVFGAEERRFLQVDLVGNGGRGHAKRDEGREDQCVTHGGEV